MDDKIDTKVELGDRVAGVIELPQMDVAKYIGTKTTIEAVEEHEGGFGFYIKLLTPVIGTEEGKDGDIELRASKTLSLAEDAEGKLGWTEKTKLGQYLKKMGVEHYKDLVGKDVVVQTQTSTKNDVTREYLTFN